MRNIFTTNAEDGLSISRKVGMMEIRSTSHQKLSMNLSRSAAKYRVPR